MATTSLIINTKDQEDKALTKTITNVNANCASSTLKTVAQMLNGLTTNTYVKTDRVDKSNVDTATDTPKQTRNITLAVTKVNPSSPSANLVQDIADDVTEVQAVKPNTGTLQIWLKNDHNDVDVMPTYSYVSEDGITMSLYYVQKNLYGDDNGYVAIKWQMQNYDVNKSVTVTVNLPESAAYAAYTRTVTFNFV